MVNNKARTASKRTKNRGNRSTGSFGPVSQINTAPVSVGNSVRGSRPRITQSIDGARVVGRDFAFGLSGSGASVTNWELIGGMPITPCALPSSVLRNYCQMFQKFKVNKIIVHYITSSPTSQAGDIMFYYERDALAPRPDYTSSNFLPFVLSDPHTVIGPQWTNHTMEVKPTNEWKTTLFGNQSDLNEQVAGSIFLFSKTVAANSPGYILIDYDITFKSMAVNPRAGSLPVARAQSTFVCFHNTAAAQTAGTAFAVQDPTTGDTIADVVSAIPTGTTSGDVFKCMLQVTASTQVNAAWTNVNSTNLIRYADNKTVTIDDGFTCYVRYEQAAANQWIFYSTVENAVTGSQPLEFGVTAIITFRLCAELQLVRNIDDFTQSSY